MDGKCTQLTEEVPDEWIRETSVTGLHVATAVGTKGPKLENMTREVSGTKGEGIFELNLQSIALIKRRYENTVENERDFVYSYKKSSENDPYPNLITIKKVTQFEAMVHTRDNDWLKRVLRPMKSERLK